MSIRIIDDTIEYKRIAVAVLSPNIPPTLYDALVETLTEPDPDAFNDGYDEGYASCRDLYAPLLEAVRAMKRPPDAVKLALKKIYG